MTQRRRKQQLLPLKQNQKLLPIEQSNSTDRPRWEHVLQKNASSYIITPFNQSIISYPMPQPTLLLTNATYAVAMVSPNVIDGLILQIHHTEYGEYLERVRGGDAYNGKNTSRMMSCAQSGTSIGNVSLPVS